VKLRQPLQEAAFAVGTAREHEVIHRYQTLIQEELNVKRVRLLDQASEAVDYRLKPLPKQLGQKHGAKFPAIRKAILALDSELSSSALLAGESLTVVVNGEKIEILPDEVEVLLEAHEGFSAVADGAYLAALVTTLSDELIQEGLAREVVRRIQELRKKADLNVDDTIRVAYTASAGLTDAIQAYQEYILAETLSVSCKPVDKVQMEEQASFTFSGEQLTVGLDRTG